MNQKRRGKEVSFVSAWLLRSGCCAVMLVGTSCTELLLKPHRNDALLNSYHYGLGEQYITVNGLKLCYQELGQGPDLIVLPGLGTSIDFWRLNVPVLAEHYHVLALDLPGFGKSDKPDVAYDLRWIRDQIVAFMDAKGIRQAHIVGGSMGGHLAIMIAMEYPQRVNKMVLAGSSGTWTVTSPLVNLAIHTLWNDAVVTDHLRRNWPEIFRKLFSTRSSTTEELFCYQCALRANGKAYAPEGRASSRALRSIFLNSCRSELKDIKQPTLLIWGQGDRYHLPHEALYFRSHMPDCRLVFIPGAAHEVMVDQSDTFNELTLAFLEKGPAAVKENLDPHGPLH